MAPDHTRDKVNFLREGVLDVDVMAYYLLEKRVKTVGRSFNHLYSTPIAISKRFGYILFKIVKGKKTPYLDNDVIMKCHLYAKIELSNNDCQNQRI